MTIRLSTMFNDPELRRIFARAEQDNGPAAAIPEAPKPVLPIGDSRELAGALDRGDVDGALALVGLELA